LRHRLLMRKKVSTDLGGKIAVDRKIVPFQQVADHSSGDQSTDVRGIHVALPSPAEKFELACAAPFVATASLDLNTSL
jgi:hypothetical protein